MADHPLVTISGGADEAGTMYEWTVTNLYASPIVYVEFPHYRANLFFAPDDWSTDETTNLVTQGKLVQSGLCKARSSADSSGIKNQHSADFRMQLSPGAVQRGSGKVTLQFADGSGFVVRGVELPQPVSLGDQYVSLIGLGSIFVIFLITTILKQRRTQATNRSFP